MEIQIFFNFSRFIIKFPENQKKWFDKLTPFNLDIKCTGYFNRDLEFDK